MKNKQKSQSKEELMQENQKLFYINQQMMQQLSKFNGSNQIIGEVNGEKITLNNEQVVNILKEQQEAVKRLTDELELKTQIIKKIQDEN